MIYEAKEFTLKDGLKVILKTPEVKEAEALLLFIMEAADQTDFLLSSSEDFRMDVEKEEKFIEGYSENGDYIIAAYVDGKIVGDCGLTFNRHVKDRHRSSVGITIDREYWNRGIGSLMFEEMTRLAKEKEGIEQMELGVISTNERAKHLYAKYGFEKTGVIPRAIKLKDGSYLDEELMTKFLYR